MDFLFITPRTVNDDFDNYLKTSLMNLKKGKTQVTDDLVENTVNKIKKELSKQEGK